MVAQGFNSSFFDFKVDAFNHCTKCLYKQNLENGAKNNATWFTGLLWRLSKGQLVQHLLGIIIAWHIAANIYWALTVIIKSSNVNLNCYVMFLKKCNVSEKL